MASGPQVIGAAANQLNEITLYENKSPRRVPRFTENSNQLYHRYPVSRKIHTEKDQAFLPIQNHETPFDLVSKECFSSKTGKNSILKSSCMVQKPLLKRSEMQETGFSKDFSRDDIKRSGQYFVDTFSRSNPQKNSGIEAERKPQTQIVSPPKPTFEVNRQTNSNYFQPLSPPCSNRIKTLVDLNCKSISS